MVFSWLSKLLAALLVVTLFGTIFAIVLNQTVLSSHYLEGQLTADNSYSKLSDAIVAEFVKNANPPSTAPQVATEVKAVVTPAVLQQKINPALDQLEAYYKGNGAPPTIDLSDLIAQAQAAGLSVPKDANLDKPIVLSGNSQVKGASKQFEHVKLASILLSLLLIVALLAVSWERHKFATLPDVAIVLGVLVGFIATIFSVAPGIVDKHAKFNFSSNAFASTAHDLAIHIAHNLGERFAIIAAVLFIIGVATRILVARMKPKMPTAPKRHPATATR